MNFNRCRFQSDTDLTSVSSFLCRHFYKFTSFLSFCYRGLEVSLTLSLEWTDESWFFYRSFVEVIFTFCFTALCFSLSVFKKNKLRSTTAHLDSAGSVLTWSVWYRHITPFIWWIQVVSIRMEVQGTTFSCLEIICTFRYSSVKQMEWESVTCTIGLNLSLMLMLWNRLLDVMLLELPMCWHKEHFWKFLH